MKFISRGPRGKVSALQGESLGGAAKTAKLHEWTLSQGEEDMGKTAKTLPVNLFSLTENADFVNLSLKKVAL
ncbi:MAG: hypothetical protein LIO95_05380 [Clostridiales bacterium]|nr:hypothetical protein [Clostridiales bacterium]